MGSENSLYHNIGKACGTNFCELTETCPKKVFVHTLGNHNPTSCIGNWNCLAHGKKFIFYFILKCSGKTLWRSHAQKIRSFSTPFSLHTVAQTSPKSHYLSSCFIKYPFQLLKIVSTCYYIVETQRTWLWTGLSGKVKLKKLIDGIRLQQWWPYFGQIFHLKMRDSFPSGITTTTTSSTNSY